MPAGTSHAGCIGLTQDHKVHILTHCSQSLAIMSPATGLQRGAQIGFTTDHRQVEIGAGLSLASRPGAENDQRQYTLGVAQLRQA